jgi:ClpP class serine protease
MKILDVAVAQRWAMLEPWVRTVLEIAGRENPPIEAVETRIGRKLDNTRNVTVRDGVALIPVTGPIFPKANLFTELSGATSIEVLAKDFASALNDGSVKSIILNMDSPGGSVAGIHEFSEMVYAARGRKPIVAYVGSMAASAAYWIASAADEIVMDETADVGSIGVVAVVPDPAKRQTKDLEIVSSQSPKKRPDYGTETGKAIVQREVDQLADIFIDRVARNRGVSADHVLERFGGGGMQLAAEAIESGMANRRGSLEGLISNLAASQRLSFVKSQPRNAATEEPTMAEGNGILSRIAGFFGINSEAKGEATADEVMAAAEAQKIEIERLRALVADAEAKQAQAAAEAGEERQKAIEAEITAAVAKYGSRFGRESEALFSTLLREVKAGSASEPSLLAFIDSLPPTAPTTRVEPVAVDTEAVADAASGNVDPHAALNTSIEATLAGRGLKKGTAEFARAFTDEFNRIRSEAKK